MQSSGQVKYTSLLKPNGIIPNMKMYTKLVQ